MSVKMTEDSDKFEMELDETDLQELYSWIDEIPLSRPKKNISRDFCDGGIKKSMNLLYFICIACEISLMKPLISFYVLLSREYSLEN